MTRCPCSGSSPVVSVSRMICRIPNGRLVFAVFRQLHAKAVQVLPEFRADFGMIQREMQPRLEIAELAAAVVTRAFEHVREDILLLQQCGDAVGQLDFAALTGFRSLEMMENARSQDITS